MDMEGVPSERIVVHVENEFDFQKKTEKRCDRLLFFIIVKPTINFTLARLGNLASERVYSRNCCSLKCKHIFGLYYNTDKRLVAVPIELKSGKAEESDVVEQLENSLKFAEKIAASTSTSQTEYCPVLFQGRGIKWSSPSRLKQLRVRFRGKNLQVLRGKCGGKKHLVNLLTNSGYL